MKIKKRNNLYPLLTIMMTIGLIFACDDGGGGTDSVDYGITEKYTNFGQNIEFTMRLVPKGTFTLHEGGPEMTISKDYLMAETEVTQEIWGSVMGNNPSEGVSSLEPGDIPKLRPVDAVTWTQAIAFCNKLSLLTGRLPVYSVKQAGSTEEINWHELKFKEIPPAPAPNTTEWLNVEVDWDANGYRLPTEMEWMWAAMGARDSATGYAKKFSGNTIGKNDDDINAYAWYSGNPLTKSKTHQVAKLKPNELGLYDMSGNVQEWCWDRYYPEYPEPIENTVDYSGPSKGWEDRVKHGGSYVDYSDICTITFRSGGEPSGSDGSNHHTGLRVVREKP